MSVQLGGIVANNIYRADDAPKYKRGNKVLIAINVLVICIFLFTKAYYVLRNRYRDKIWNAMTPEVRIIIMIRSVFVTSNNLLYVILIMCVGTTSLHPYY